MKISLNAEWQALVDEHQHETNIRNQRLVRQLVLWGCILTLVFAVAVAFIGSLMPDI